MKNFSIAYVFFVIFLSINSDMLLNTLRLDNPKVNKNAVQSKWSVIFVKYNSFNTIKGVFLSNHCK